jgi:hypothetical protein
MVQQIKDLSIKPETIKLLKENMTEKFLYINLANDFLGITLKALATKAKIDK